MSPFEKLTKLKEYDYVLALLSASSVSWMAIVDGIIITLTGVASLVLIVITIRLRLKETKKLEEDEE